MQLKESTPFPNESAATISWHTHSYNPLPCGKLSTLSFVIVSSCLAPSAPFPSLSFCRHYHRHAVSLMQWIPTFCQFHLNLARVWTLDAIHSRVSEELGAIIAPRSLRVWRTKSLKTCSHWSGRNPPVSYWVRSTLLYPKPIFFTFLTWPITPTTSN